MSDPKNPRSARARRTVVTVTIYSFGDEDPEFSSLDQVAAAATSNWASVDFECATTQIGREAFVKGVEGQDSDVDFFLCKAPLVCVTEDGRLGNPYALVIGKKVWLDWEGLAEFETKLLEPAAHTDTCICGQTILNCEPINKSQDLSCREMALKCRGCQREYPILTDPEDPDL